MKPISEIFSKSVNLLKQHKKLLIPFWALSMLFYVLFAIFLYGSGLYPAMNEYYGHVEAFNVIQAEHLSEEIGMEDNKIMTDFLSFMGTKRSGQDEEFKRYLEEQNYEYDAF
ncbi:MAG: hypothetical protein KKG59_07265, partial [Nanoarchaeota archaeon]|nr:hypothetical protein [Nanoarchaeota archaeon]